MKYQALVLILFLVGCASVETQPPSYEQGKFPELDTVTTVNVGQVMVTEYDYLSQARAVLLQEIDGSFWAGREPALAGTSLPASLSGGRQVFCVQSRRQGAPCFEDSDQDGKLDRAYTFNAFQQLVSGRNIDPVAYRMADEAIQDGFKYELIYQGIDRGVVRIAYREYTDNLARPAFSQDLTYTLQGALTEVRFRNMSLEIQSANNNEITYIVRSGF